MIRFGIHTTGPADAPVMVFVHGFMGSAADFAPVAAGLDERLRCVRVDLPGHAGIPLPDGPLSMPSLAAELREQVLAPLADKSGRAPMLVGYSMGGRLALQTALDWPDEVGRVALVSTSPGIIDSEGRRVRRQHDAERAARICEDLDGFLDSWYRLPIFGALRDHDAFDAMLERRRRNDARRIARVIVELSPGRQPANWERLDQLDEATWFVGADDPKYHRLGMELRERGHHVCVAPGAAHALHIERADWLTRDLRQPA